MTLSIPASRAIPPGEAGALVQALDLAPHPEGGWYRETWRAPSLDGARSGSTAILFLLPAGERSHWHAVDADEIWLHQGGGPLLLEIAGADGLVTSIRLGQNAQVSGADGAGNALQAVVPRGHMQAARPLGAWSLVACVVAPGFSFEGFVLAPPDWRPGDPL